MKYNIISIDDARKPYKDRIRARVGLSEIWVPAVNAREVDINKELEDRGLFITHPGSLTVGEIGVWLSTFDCWRWADEYNEDLLVFEDDAIPVQTFNKQFRELTSELPPDYDFLCLWVPENQLLDYIYDVVYDDEGLPTHVGPNKNMITSNYNFGSTYLARVYNGYGNVAQLYSPKGARFFMDRARAVGIYTPVDCYLYQEAHAGRCEGYAPKPNRAKLVKYDWKAETTIHNTERF